MLKIALAADHAGFELKSLILIYLQEKGYVVEDYGCHSSESCDYADYAHPLAVAVEDGIADFGIVCCGSGNGINMTVNKHQGIRSAICWNLETARLARAHNDANICSLPSRFVLATDALQIVDIFLHTNFEYGRHLMRIRKIPL